MPDFENNSSQWMKLFEEGNDVAAILVANACFHIWGVIRLKAYSPGVVTAVLLYIPLFVIGSIQLVGTGILP